MAECSRHPGHTIPGCYYCQTNTEPQAGYELTPPQQSFNQLVRDLAYLDDHGALAGVEEIVRERRRQIEQKGYTPEHDDTTSGMLAYEAGAHLKDLMRDRYEGTADQGSDEAHLRKAGALAAAEIDRMNRP